MLVAVTIAAVREQAMETASWRCQIKDLVSSGVGYDRRAGKGRGDGYGSVRRDRYNRRVGSVGSVNRAVSVRGAEYDRSVGSDLIIIAPLVISIAPLVISIAPSLVHRLVPDP